MSFAATVRKAALIDQFRRELVDRYPQYENILRKGTRLVRAKRSYGGGRIAGSWYQANELLLAFGDDEKRMTWNRKTMKNDIERVYITVYSIPQNGLCLAPREHFEVIE